MHALRSSQPYTQSMTTRLNPFIDLKMYASLSYQKNYFTVLVYS